MDNTQNFAFFDPQGVYSLRKNGYRHTSMALAELVDNSIQAGANNVEIILIQKQKSVTRKQWHVDEVLVFDDGDGMTPEVLQIALRFGGGNRYDANAGLGKFGMGLPNSSASQCKRFEVYSWQSVNSIYHNYFDFDEIFKQGTGFLPIVQKVDELPARALETLKLKSAHGTLVHWKDCDGVNPKRANTIIKHMMVPLGRTFRYYLKDDLKIKIRVFDDNGHSLSEKKDLQTDISPVDPMFLMEDCHYPEKCMETGPTNVVFTDDETHSISFTEERDDGSTLEHSATLKFSIAMPETQNKGGGAELGKHYGQNVGISVIRAGREIKLDTFGFIGDVSDPRQRWWSCEVGFEPVSDDLFGLDNSKQNVFNFRKIEPKEYDMLCDGDEDLDPSLQFMFLLSKCIVGNISAMRLHIDKLNKGKKAKACFNPDLKCDGRIIDGTCSKCGFTPKNCDKHPEVLLSADGSCHLCNRFDPVPTPNPVQKGPGPSEKERIDLEKFLTKRYEEYREDDAKLKMTVNWFFQTPHSQIIVFDDMGPGVLYDYKVIGVRTLIEVNSNHQFYETFISPAMTAGDYDELTPMLLFFGALVEAERNSEDTHGIIEEYRGQVGLKLNKGIRFWRDHALPSTKS
jgi:hypothetical protein